MYFCIVTDSKYINLVLLFICDCLKIMLKDVTNQFATEFFFLTIVRFSRINFFHLQTNIYREEI